MRPRDALESSNFLMSKKSDSPAPATAPDAPDEWSSSQERIKNKIKNLPPLFYDKRDGAYWFLLDGEWTPLKKADLRVHFEKAGIPDIPYDGLSSALKWPTWYAQTYSKVDYAGSISGNRAGIRIVSRKKYLVTDEADPAVWNAKAHKKFPKEKVPQWGLDFIENLLPIYYDGKTKAGTDQGELLKFWLGIGLEAMVTGNLKRPGQLVVFAGKSGTGKNLMQAFITEIFGGRVANPFKFLSQGKFNSALGGAEHWEICDPDSTTDMKTRRLVGSKLKQCLVNPDFDIEKKGKDELKLPLFRRMTLSVNQEPENLSVVPPLDDSMLDKVFLFLCSPGKVGNDQNHLGRMLVEQAPLMRDWLLTHYCAAKVPKEWRDPENERMGIRGWQHPELLEILSGLSIEAKLLDALDRILFTEKSSAIDRVIGTAAEIEKRLRDSHAYSDTQLDKLFPHTSTCGTLLERLSRDFPDRVRIEKHKSQNSGKTIWRLLPPQPEANNTEKES